MDFMGNAVISTYFTMAEASRDSHFYARSIRELSLRLVHKAKASHIASALSIADLLAVIYFGKGVINFESPDHPERDRILLSKGHACTALYSALYFKDLYALRDLFTYGEDSSRFMNHASHHVPGVEFSTGALGHALPVGCGMALAAKLEKKTWHTFVIISDGELQEGSNWEAMLFANHHQLDNLSICIDFNNLQSLTTTDQTISLRPLSEKLKAFGWSVAEVDGHEHEQLRNALIKARRNNKPTAIILNTVKGKGVSFMENSVAWHYRSPSDEELQNALQELGVQ
jgi:transketolase